MVQKPLLEKKGLRRVHLFFDELAAVQQPLLEKKGLRHIAVRAQRRNAKVQQPLLEKKGARSRLRLILRASIFIRSLYPAIASLRNAQRLFY